MFRKMTHLLSLSLMLATSIPDANAQFCTPEKIDKQAPWRCTCDILETCRGAVLGSTWIDELLDYLKVTETIPPNLKNELSYLGCMAWGMAYCDNWDWPEPGANKLKCGLKMCDYFYGHGLIFKTRKAYLANNKDVYATAKALLAEDKREAAKMSGKDEKKEPAEPKKAEEKTEKK